MVSVNEKKELFSKFEKLNRDITALRTELNQLDEQKEAAFDNKESYSNKIAELIRKVKEHKEKRDRLTKEVKEDKARRDSCNSEIKKKIDEAKKLNDEKEGIVKKHDITASPFRLKEEIDRLERKIETDVMSFEKEKELVKKIKGLKKKYNETKAVTDFYEKSRIVSKDIDGSKREAEEIHRRIQNKSKESQNSHEEMIKVSGEIDSLREKEKEAFLKFSELKQKFNGVNSDLKKKLLELNELNDMLREYKVETKEIRKKREEAELKSKEALVKEKIKKGGKITTEDLLVMREADLDDIELNK